MDGSLARRGLKSNNANPKRKRDLSGLPPILTNQLSRFSENEDGSLSEHQGLSRTTSPSVPIPGHVHPSQFEATTSGGQTSLALAQARFAVSFSAKPNDA